MGSRDNSSSLSLQHRLDPESVKDGSRFVMAFLNIPEVILQVVSRKNLPLQLAGATVFIELILN